MNIIFLETEYSTLGMIVSSLIPFLLIVSVILVPIILAVRSSKRRKKIHQENQNLNKNI